MPAEREDFCPHCGDAPCQHPHQGLDWSQPRALVRDTGWLLLLLALSWVLLAVAVVL